MPYPGCFDEIDTLSIDPSGDVRICNFTIGNIYTESMDEIVNRFDPNKHPLMSVHINGGIKELLKTAEKEGIKADLSKHYSMCSVCNDIVRKIQCLQMKRV